jgi:hypothetical protein
VPAEFVALTVKWNGEPLVFDGVPPMVTLPATLVSNVAHDGSASPTFVALTLKVGVGTPVEVTAMLAAVPVWTLALVGAGGLGVVFDDVTVNV